MISRLSIVLSIARAGRKNMCELAAGYYYISFLAVRNEK